MNIKGKTFYTDDDDRIRIYFIVMVLTVCVKYDCGKTYKTNVSQFFTSRLQVSSPLNFRLYPR